MQPKGDPGAAPSLSLAFTDEDAELTKSLRVLSPDTREQKNDDMIVIHGFLKVIFAWGECVYRAAGKKYEVTFGKSHGYKMSSSFLRKFFAF